MKRFIQQIEHLDILLFKKIINEVNHPFIQQVALFLTRLGHGPFYLSIIPVIMLTVPHYRRAIAIIVITIGLEKILYICLSNLFKRKRPCSKLPGFQHVIRPPNGFSFPSGHTSSAFCMATLLSFYYPSFTITLYIFASMIAVSRLILKVHFPLDILAGCLLGLICAYSALAFFY